MKTFYSRLMFIFAVLYAILLASLGIVLGQLFPIFTRQRYSHGGTKEAFAILAESFEQDSILFYILLIGTLVVFYLISVWMASLIISRYIKPIDDISEIAIQLADGNYAARVYEDDLTGITPLSQSLNVLARNLQEVTQLRETEQERLKTLIETMGSGLIVLGRSGSITIMNKPFSEMFQLDGQNAHSKNYQDIGLPQELQQFAYRLLMTETATRQQLAFATPKGQRYTECYGAPIIGEYGKWLGMVIVVHDISELKRLEKVRQDFVANVSHELKTPVTSIKGFTETLLYGAYKKEETLLEFLEIIQQESDRLQLLINDLLDLSKMEQQTFSLSLEPVSFALIVSRANQLISHAADEKSITVQTTSVDDVVVRADENRLLQIVVNLISNAITYSPEKTQVSIHYAQVGAYGNIVIEDQGIGMEQQELGRIFERFYRVDKARSRNSGGTGLGLAIVKHLVEAHQGKIKVESEPGKGTTFTVSIPLFHS